MFNNNQDVSKFMIPGDPFVDNGLWAMTVMADLDHPSKLQKTDVDRVIRELLDWFFSGELKKVLYMLYTNYPLFNPNPAYTKEKREKMTVALLFELSNLVFDNASGFPCAVCGKKQAHLEIQKDPDKPGTLELLPALRTYVPMLGSKTLINFFPHGSTGLHYCASCLLACQFLPIMVWPSKNLILAHSYDEEIMRAIADMQVKAFRERKAIESLSRATGGATRTTNALFRVVENLVVKLEGDCESPNLTFYDFTNYGQGANIEGIITFPNKAFIFYRSINRINGWQSWNVLLKRGFSKKALEPKRKQTPEEAEEEAFRSKRNQIYDNLLHNRSIVGYFINHQKRKLYGSWELLSLYLEIVRKFNAEN
ncbi:MAG: type I-B CRISPR-associated protein Cas8b1/Cst1 [Candidatus Hodarchaeota archaeon]